MEEYSNTQVETIAEVPKPPEALSDDVQALILKMGDQPRSAEIDVAPGLTLTIGVRHTYINADGIIVTLNNITIPE